MTVHYLEKAVHLIMRTEHAWFPLKEAATIIMFQEEDKVNTYESNDGTR